MFTSLLLGITPTLLQSVAEMFSCFRMLKLRLPDITDSDDLKMFMSNLSNKHKSLSDLEENLPQHAILIESIPYAIYNSDQDWKLNYINNDRGSFMTNWPQFITLYFTQTPRNEKYLYILSSFTSPQMVERNKLIRNIDMI